MPVSSQAAKARVQPAFQAQDETYTLEADSPSLFPVHVGAGLSLGETEEAPLHKKATMLVLSSPCMPVHALFSFKHSGCGAIKGKILSLCPLPVDSVPSRIGPCTSPAMHIRCFVPYRRCAWQPDKNW